MGRRAASLLACALLATGCSAVASSAESGPTTSSSSSSTAPTTTAAPDVVAVAPETTTTTAAPAPTAAAPAAMASPELRHALEVAWSRAPSSSCLMVVEAGHVLYERNPDTPVLPASTIKLLTAQAVLAHVPVGTRFHTPVLAASPPQGGTISGDLWLVGTGDPTLVTGDYLASKTRKPAVSTSLESLADRVVAAGVRRVTGRVLADDSRFDQVRAVPSWPTHYLAEGESGALSALMVNDGLATWEPTEVAHPDAAQRAGELLVELLRQRGVQIDGGAGRAVAPAGLVALAGVDSATVGELVADMLRESDNTSAELLLKELGRRVAGQPSTEAGAAVALDTLRRQGLPVDGTRMVDGSGLSRENRVTCRLLAALLAKLPAGSPTDAGLAVAGSTGTLWKRLVDQPAAGRVRAKTGSISGVMGLAGYAAAPNGAKRTFVFELNDLGNSLAGRILHDEVANALVTR